MRKFRLLLTATLLLITSLAWAQTKTIKGTVTDESGLPISFATISIKGTNIANAADDQGRYTIQAKSGATLVVSATGYATKEAVIGSDVVNIILSPGNTQVVDEVMVIGYGAVKKENFTGSASVVKADVFENRPVTSFEKALQGAAAGVQVTSVSGQPGATSTVRIRGVGSFAASSTPLYVIDGVPITNGDLTSTATTADVLATLNPNDIASVTVLKDATAAAIYGSRAGNGVILITTKQGKIGRTKLNLNASTGFSNQAVKYHDVMNASEYYKMYWDVYYADSLKKYNDPAKAALLANAATNAKLAVNPYNTANPYIGGGALADGAALLYDTDWRDEVLRKGITNNIDLSVSGGNEKTKFFFSGGYFDQKGIIIASDFKRYSSKLNINTDITSFLKIGINNTLSYTIQNTPPGATGSANPVNFANQTANIYPLYVYDANGNIVLDASGNPTYSYKNPVTPDFNPVGLSKLNEYNVKTARAITNPYVEVRFLKDFVAKSSLGVDYISLRERQFYNMEHGDGVSVKGRGYRYSKEDLSITIANTLTYNKSFGEHNVNVLLGQEAYRTKFENLYAQATGYPFPGIDELIAASTPNTTQSYFTEKRLSSYFSRVEYNLGAKYYLSGSLRRDGSSVFGADRRFGTFYSIGGAWRIGKEEFLQSANWIDDLKIRASYGTSGNDRIDRYAAQGLYSLGRNYEGQSGINYTQLANLLLQWEQNSTLDLGLEFSLFKGGLSGEIGYYKRGAQDILFDKPLSRLTGFNTIPTNLASMDNYGIEVLLNGNPVRTANFNWNVSFNITSNNNKIRKMTQEQVIDGTKRWTVGEDRYQWYLREYAGVDPADGRPMWYQDEVVDGKPTGKKITTKNWSSATRYEGFGSALPKFTGGFNNSFTYKQFDLDIRTYYSLGAKIYDNLYANLMHSGGSVGKQLATDIYGQWKNPGDVTDIPRFVINNTDLGNNESTRFLFNGSFMRVKNISLGYSLNPDLLKTLQLSNLRIYFMAENPFTFAAHKGMDPEVEITGLANNDIPNVKTFTFGINVGF
jgi:TonB-linked SusC/RagA family outer membrane protein